MTTTRITKVNQHAVRFDLGRTASGTHLSYRVPAVNIDLDQREADGTPFEISKYFEFAVKIGDKVFYYVASESRHTGGWSLEVLRQGDRVDFDSRADQPGADDRETLVFVSYANLAIALRNIFSVGTILSAPGKVYEETFRG